MREAWIRSSTPSPCCSCACTSSAPYRDVSSSNTLFVATCGEFAAYLVDAETGDAPLTGQREYDGPGAYEHHRRTYGSPGWRLFHHGRRFRVDAATASALQYDLLWNEVTAEDFAQ